MPEEIINNEIMNEAVEVTVETVAKTPKKMRGGKIAAVGILITGVAALGYWAYNKAKTHRNSEENAAAANGKIIDNVKVAEHDFVDKNESEE